MTVHTKVSKDDTNRNSKQIRMLSTAETTYNRLAVYCVENGIYKQSNKGSNKKGDYSVPQYLTAKKLLESGKDGVAYVNKVSHFIHNSAMTTSKAQGVITAGFPHSPMVENQRVSERSQANVATVAATKELIKKEYDLDSFYSYMITFTIKSAAINLLQSRFLNLKKIISMLNTAFKDSNRGKGRFRISAVGGGFAKYLGDHTAFEITVNEENVINRVDYDTTHPHAHSVMLFADELDLKTPVTLTQQELPNLTQRSCVVSAAKADFLRWYCNSWYKLDPNLQISPDAFDIRATYSKYVDVVDGKRQTIIEDDFEKGLVEANKYTLKASSWHCFRDAIEGSVKYPKAPKGIDRYLGRLFAAIMRTMKNQNMQISHGIVYKAKQFVSKSKKIGLGSPVLGAHYYGDENTEYVPDLFTRVSSFDLKLSPDNKVGANGKLLTHKGVSNLNKTISLNDEQILYFNKSILSGVGFDASLFNQINFKNDSASRNAKYLYSQLVFASKGRDGLLNTLTGWRDSLQDKLLLLQAENKKIDSNNSILLKLADVNRVIEAVENCIDDKGRYDFQVDWSRRFNMINLMNTMQSIDGLDGQHFSDIFDFAPGSADELLSDGHIFQDKIEPFIVKLFRFVCEAPIIARFDELNHTPIYDRVINAYLECLNVNYDDFSEMMLTWTAEDYVNSNDESLRYIYRSLGLETDLNTKQSYTENYTDSPIDNAIKLQRVINKF